LLSFPLREQKRMAHLSFHSEVLAFTDEAGNGFAFVSEVILANLESLLEGPETNDVLTVASQPLQNHRVTGLLLLRIFIVTKPSWLRNYLSSNFFSGDRESLKTPQASSTTFRVST
jgi:hypothetical protein